MLMGQIDRVPRALLFERAEERLHSGIVPTIAFA